MKKSILIINFLFLYISIIYSQAKPEMILVDGGSYKMGYDLSMSSDEKPAHVVNVNSFYIAKYELTFEEYDAFTTATGWIKADDDYKWGRGKRPVINVTWQDAVMYCNWLSIQHGLTPCYEIDRKKANAWKLTCNFEANGYRLPTEAEWEFAARGGFKSKFTLYSGSDKPDEVAYFNANSKSQTHTVGSLKPNELGIYDMSGNVFEWCWDFYDSKYYNSSPKSNPTGEKSGKYRVLRGGGWYYLYSFSTVYKRYSALQDHRSSFFGIRLCRSAK